MNKNIYLVLVLFSLAACSPKQLSTTNREELTATELNPYVRYSVNAQNELELISSGVHFGLTFRGNEVKLFVSNFSEGGHSFFDASDHILQ